MAKTEDLQTLETRIHKQREVVEKEKNKLAAFESDFHKALYDTIAKKAQNHHMSLPDYLSTME